MTLSLYSPPSVNGAASGKETSRCSPDSRLKAPQGPRHKAPKGPRYTILDTLKQFRQPEPPINRPTTRTRTRPRTSGPGTRLYSRAYASGPEPDLTPDVRCRRTTESSSSSSSSSSPSFVVIVVVVSPSHWGAGAAEEAGAEAEAGGGGGGGRLEDQRKTRKTRCSTRSTKVPYGSENPRERGSDLEVGLESPGGTSPVLGRPSGRFPGCTGEPVWGRARRGVGKAEVPGEADSEGNRPKGATPV